MQILLPILTCASQVRWSSWILEFKTNPRFLEVGRNLKCTNKYDNVVIQLLDKVQRLHIQ